MKDAQCLSVFSQRKLMRLKCLILPAGLPRGAPASLTGSGSTKLTTRVIQIPVSSPVPLVGERNPELPDVELANARG